jgi:formate dehydrogenase subunit gamma
MQEIERYRKAARIHHWWIVVWALMLGLTGLFLFLSWFSPAAWWGWSRLFHRIAAVLFVAGPVIYFLLYPKQVLEWIKEAFTWGKDDIGWLKAAPIYYFGGDEGSMPPQDRSNTGQKMWMLVVIIAGLAFVVTGFFLWFLKGIISPGVFQAMLLIHDVAFIGAGAMLLVHVALGAFHPRFSEAMRSITSGSVSAEYAKSHHGKWYDRIVSGEETANHSKKQAAGENKPGLT